MPSSDSSMPSSDTSIVSKYGHPKSLYPPLLQNIALRSRVLTAPGEGERSQILHLPCRARKREGAAERALPATVGGRMSHDSRGRESASSSITTSPVRSRSAPLPRRPRRLPSRGKEMRIWNVHLGRGA